MNLTGTHIQVIGVLITIILLAAVGTIYVMRNTDQAILPETRELFSQAERDNGNYTYVTETGEPKALDEYLGKVVIVTLWASWSPYSATDLPMLDALAEELLSENIAVVALNRKETLPQAQRYLATIPALEHVSIIIDTEDRFYQSVSGYAMPETLIYDTRGNLTHHLHGQVDSTTLRDYARALLE